MAFCPCFRDLIWTVSSLKQFKSCRSVWQYQFSLVVSCFTDKISRMDISLCVVNRRLQGRSQEVSKRGGGHTGSYRGYSPDCHLNIVGCLLIKRLTKGGEGARAPQDLSGYALGLLPGEKKPKASRYWRYSACYYGNSPSRHRIMIRGGKHDSCSYAWNLVVFKRCFS